MRNNRDANGLLTAALCLILAIVIVFAGAAVRSTYASQEAEQAGPDRITVAVNKGEGRPLAPETLPSTVETERTDVIKPSRNQIEIAELPNTEVNTEVNTHERVENALDADPAIVLAKMVYGEGRNQPPMQMAAIVWCALNRVDAGYGDIISVVTAPGQFVGYSASNPVEEHILEIVNDVLTRWENGGEGRTLPSDYLWFTGTGTENVFRNAYSGGDAWDWSLPDPYEG